MGMADEVRRQHQADSNDRQKYLAREQDARQQTRQLIEACVPDFINAARDLGVQPTGIIRRHWLVLLSFPYVEGHRWSLPIQVRTDGRWFWMRTAGRDTFTRAKEAEVTIHSRPSPDEVRSAFTAWLTRESR